MRPKLSTFESKSLTNLFIEILKGNNYAHGLAKITGNEPSPIAIQLRKIKKEGYLLTEHEPLLNKTRYKPNWKNVLINYFGTEGLLPPNLLTNKDAFDSIIKFFDNSIIQKELFGSEILDIFPDEFAFYDIISLFLTIIVIKYIKVTTKEEATSMLFFITTSERIASKYPKIVVSYDAAISKKIKENQELNSYLNSYAPILYKVVIATIKQHLSKMFFYNRIK